MDLKKIIILSISFIFIFFITVFVIIYIDKSDQKKFFEQSYIDFSYQKDRQDLQSIVDDTIAEGVIVYDLKNNKILAQKNINKKYSLASITKIVTGYLVYEKDKNKLNTIREMMKTSDNKQAETLAEIFASSSEGRLNYVNEKTQKYDFKFRNLSGLDVDIGGIKLPGGEGKPLDVVNFIKDYYIQYPEIFDQTLIQENNTNTIVKDLKFLAGGKTGYTDLSGGNLFISIQKGLDREIFILVLNSTEKNRFVDVQNIANFLLKSSI